MKLIVIGFSILILLASSLHAEENHGWWLHVENELKGTYNEYFRETLKSCKAEARIINDAYDGLFVATCVPAEDDDLSDE